MKGADVFVESLLKEGVDAIFGHPGGAILPLNDALYSGRIRHILTRHEQGAIHMAEGYARATGRPGVVLVTSGPGGTNVITGLTDAFMDSTPVVVFTGQVPTGVIGNDAFQEADIVGMTRSCTKHNYLVRDVQDLARTIKEAFHIASTGRPGPVLVDIPKDVSQAECDFAYPTQVNLRGYKPTIHGHAGQLRRAAEMIAAAKRPVIYAGGGVIHSGASESLRQVAELTATPVTNTLMGLGGFPGVHELWLGMLGMHGTVTANTAMNEADLVIARRPLRRPGHGQRRRVLSQRQVYPYRYRSVVDWQKCPGRCASCGRCAGLLSPLARRTAGHSEGLARCAWCVAGTNC